MKTKYAFVNAPGEFPLDATKLKLAKYTAMGAIGQMETEEAAVRLLFFSQQNGRFVGVSWSDVMQQAINEALIIAENNELRNAVSCANRSSMKIFESKKKSYRNWAIGTIGISTIFMNRPEKPTQEALPELDDSVKNLFSVVSIYGEKSIQMLINAFHELIKMHLIVKEKHNETDYFFPTPALVARIAHA